MRVPFKYSPGKDQGQELAEFALVLPLLLLILLGAVDLGRLFHATITISNASREGVRYLSLHHDEINNARAQAVLEAQGAGILIALGDVTVSCPLDAGGNCQRMQPGQVRVTYDFQLFLGPLLPGIGSLPGTGVRIERTAEMLVQ